MKKNKSEGVSCTPSLMKRCFFDEFLFCDWRNERPGKSGFLEDYFRISIAFFRPLSTAEASFW